MQVRFFPVKIAEVGEYYGYGNDYSRRLHQFDELACTVSFEESVEAENYAEEHGCPAITCEIVEWSCFGGGYIHRACPVFQGEWNKDIGDWNYSPIKYVS